LAVVVVEAVGVGVVVWAEAAPINASAANVTTYLEDFILSLLKRRCPAVIRD
jgi:hypothetical protein